MKTESILIHDIQCGDRLRAVDAGRVASLAASIAEIGLRTPVTVTITVDGDGEVSYRLIAGAHRLEAMKASGQDYIDAFVMDGDEDDAALWEIDENFARAELTDAQRAEHHVRREEILKRKGLVKDAPKGGRPGKNSDNLPTYSAQAAARLGVHEDTVRRELKRGKNIDAGVLAEVSGTDLDKGVVLDELARAPRENQRALLHEIKERQEADKLNRYADKAVARTSAEEAAEIIHASLGLDQVDSLMARLASVTMRDFLGALSFRRAA